MGVYDDCGFTFVCSDDCRVFMCEFLFYVLQNRLQVPQHPLGSSKPNPQTTIYTLQQKWCLLPQMQDMQPKVHRPDQAQPEAPLSSTYQIHKKQWPTFGICFPYSAKPTWVRPHGFCHAPDKTLHQVKHVALSYETRWTLSPRLSCSYQVCDV
jgi:hypothetical protein